LGNSAIHDARTKTDAAKVTQEAGVQQDMESKK
jgi:hypothetical protein